MLLTGCTLGVIPAYERDTFIMTVDVKQGDHVFKTYTYKDHTGLMVSLVSYVPDTI